MALRRREREAERDQEDAAELRFGRDFEKAGCVMNAEALIILKEIKEHRQMELEEDPEEFMVG